MVLTYTDLSRNATGVQVEGILYCVELYQEWSTSWEKASASPLLVFESPTQHTCILWVFVAVTFSVILCTGSSI